MRTMRRSRRARSIPGWLDVLCGAAAGAVGTWLMAPTMNALSRMQSEGDRNREKAGSFDENATIKFASRLAEPLGIDLSSKQRQKAGTAIHWSYGVMLGVAYAVLARRFGHASVLTGAAFGAGLWAIGDEIVVPLLGLGPKPQRLPVSAHAKTLGTHVAYGIGLDLALRTLRSAAGPVIGGDRVGLVARARRSPLGWG